LKNGVDDRRERGKKEPSFFGPKSLSSLFFLLLPEGMESKLTVQRRRKKRVGGWVHRPTLLSLQRLRRKNERLQVGAVRQTEGETAGLQVLLPLPCPVP